MASLGISSEPRKRLRVWIESFFPDGTRMGVESIELDQSEAKRLFLALAEHLKD